MEAITQQTNAGDTSKLEQRSVSQSIINLNGIPTIDYRSLNIADVACPLTEDFSRILKMFEDPGVASYFNIGSPRTAKFRDATAAPGSPKAIGLVSTTFAPAGVSWISRSMASKIGATHQSVTGDVAEDSATWERFNPANETTVSKHYSGSKDFKRKALRVVVKDKLVFAIPDTGSDRT